MARNNPAVFFDCLGRCRRKTNRRLQRSTRALHEGHAGQVKPLRLNRKLNHSVSGGVNHLGARGVRCGRMRRFGANTAFNLTDLPESTQSLF